MNTKPAQLSNTPLDRPSLEYTFLGNPSCSDADLNFFDATAAANPFTSLAGVARTIYISALKLSPKASP
jgi:hypothetical protein